MTVTFCLAAILERSTRPANTLALAALATLAFNPVNLFDIGCQLSFLAIVVLFWLVSPACTLVPTTRGSDPGLASAARPARSTSWSGSSSMRGSSDCDRRGTGWSTASSPRRWSGWRRCRSSP